MGCHPAASLCVNVAVRSFREAFLSGGVVNVHVLTLLYCTCIHIVDIEGAATAGLFQTQKHTHVSWD